MRRASPKEFNTFNPLPMAIVLVIMTEWLFLFEMQQIKGRLKSVKDVILYISSVLK